MNTYTSPEAIEIGAADEIILGAKGGMEWDEIIQEFYFTHSVFDVDE